MANDAKCAKCGATAEGIVCGFCGSLIAAAEDVDQEREALDRFHKLVGDGDPARQARMLRNGFLPDRPKVLIEAGLRCLALISEESSQAEAASGAQDRLKAVIAKLKILPRTPEAARAVEEFEGALRKRDAEGNRDALLGCTVIAVLAALTVVAGWYLVRHFWG